MKKKLSVAVAAFVAAAAAAAANDYPIRSADMTKVRVTGGFWYDRLETNRLSTLKNCFDKCNETPRIANFTNAAARAGKFGGIPFDDSDVFKVVEGAAYVLANHPDPELEKYCDWLIGQFAKAQELDGYLYTARTLGHWHFSKGGGSSGMMGPVRWSNIGSSHELYNNGHMIEAACAWFRATGKRNFLDVAVKSADLFCRVFGPDPTQLKDAPGHEEIELALAKLYRVTGRKRYLNLARHFIEMRGRGRSLEDGRPVGPGGEPVDPIVAPGAGIQDHMPVVLQREAVGHAVRAGYLYCGVADVAALTGDKAYLDAISAIWLNVSGRKLHLTGGVGGTPRGEAFERDYLLPNDYRVTYLETCAAIANALWNERMFRFSGESKYVDILERVIYNGFLSGVSLTGDEYFYPNPLACKGGYRRSKWFGCSCCPVNDVRFIPQIPSFAWATDGANIFWNLVMQGEAEVEGVKFKCDTGYPWNGRATLAVSPAAEKRFTLKLRVPGWAKGEPVPGDLYTQTVPASVKEITLSVNGAALDPAPGKDGYIDIDRKWKAGDKVEVNFPMPVKRIRAHRAVVDDLGRLAVERGPMLYCAEGCDNGGAAYDAVLPEDATFTDDTIVIGDKTFPALKASNGLKLIPYFAWDHRQPGNDMQVWFREKKPAAPPAGALKTSLVIGTDELSDRWVDRAVNLGLHNLSIHPGGGGQAEVALDKTLARLKEPGYRALIDRAKALGIDIGYEIHAASWLLPRNLFDVHPEYFRMDEKGARCRDKNFCFSNPEAMNIAGKRAVELAKALYGGNRRYCLWLDDVHGGVCKCEKCRGFSASDQQLIFANAIVTELRKFIPDAELCYLAYADAINPPEKVKPVKGVFLEYAPIKRDLGRPLADQNNGETKPLKALIEKFGSAGSRVLEYWFDNSLYSHWTSPVKLFRQAKDVVAADVEYYRLLGFEEISSFAVTLGDRNYVPLWGEPDLSAFARENVDSAFRSISLDGDAWEFRRGGSSAWSKVRVPHDWAIAGPFNHTNDYATGKLSWCGKGDYRRSFVWRKSGKPGERVYLEFDGVMARPKVKVNGKDAGGWDYGYASFILDVSALVVNGENSLEVSADTTDHKSRWYPGGGIYRSVRLVTRGDGHAIPGSVAITTPKISAAEATVNVSWRTLSGPKSASFKILKPRLWDVDDPYLYEYAVAGEKFRYGVRSVSVTTNGLFLNGRRLQIHGVNLHSDLGPLGMAFDRDAAKRQLLCMRDMGVNAVRTSHNCPAPQLLDLCDELGILVWDECFDKWDGTAGRLPGENLEEYVERNLKAFVRRDRNHPCVFTWSLGNEIYFNCEEYSQGTSRERCDRFRKAVLSEDSTRPVGIGCCYVKAVEKGDLDGLDLNGWNYGGSYRHMHARNPAMPLFYSESASAFSDYGFYRVPFAGNEEREGWSNTNNTEHGEWFRADVKNWKVDGYDQIAATWGDIADVEFDRMERDRYVCGEFVWSGIDYIGEPTPYTLWFLGASEFGSHYVKAAGRSFTVADTSRSSYFGAADICAIPKDRWHLYRSHWNKKAETVHILPHWNWNDHKGTKVPVYVYTSGDEAELFLNGRSLGRRRKGVVERNPALTNRYYEVCAKYRLRWFDVPYRPGELKAVAYRGGEKIGEAKMKTAGAPKAIRLTRDPYSAEGSDLVFVQIDAVDSKGNRSPVSDAKFDVLLKGPGEIAAVGNGDPRSMVSFKSLKGHSLWFGKAVVAVRRYRGTGDAPELTVTAPGLKPGTIKIAGR
ncbi:MAG: DUF4838 domain-containing protein [Kiritimatiellae bacterium]|nr:DUF4838 domain-containing protein [Kiritimatiellia bacterium]